MPGQKYRFGPWRIKLHDVTPGMSMAYYPACSDEECIQVRAQKGLCTSIACGTSHVIRLSYIQKDARILVVCHAGHPQGP